MSRSRTFLWLAIPTCPSHTCDAWFLLSGIWTRETEVAIGSDVLVHYGQSVPLSLSVIHGDDLQDLLNPQQFLSLSVSANVSHAGKKTGGRLWLHRRTATALLCGSRRGSSGRRSHRLCSDLRRQRRRSPWRWMIRMRAQRPPARLPPSPPPRPCPPLLRPMLTQSLPRSLRQRPRVASPPHCSHQWPLLLPRPRPRPQSGTVRALYFALVYPRMQKKARKMFLYRRHLARFCLSFQVYVSVTCTYITIMNAKFTVHGRWL